MDHALRTAASSFKTSTQRRVLSTRSVVFLVIAAAAPLTAMVGNLPIALARGNGAGIAGAFLIATLTLLCFAVGYAEISRRVVSTGAFYTYVALGLGKRTGISAAFIAVVAYSALTVGLATAFGYFASLVFDGFGATLPWWACTLAALVVTAWLGYRSVDLSSKVLGVLLIAEIAVLILFDSAVIVAQGAAAFPAESLSPRVIFGHGFAISLMFAYTAFTGFESAALFGEESAQPTRSIPRATLLSVVLIGGFYFATAWLTVGAIRGVGAAEAADISAAAAREGGELLFSLIGRYCGAAMSHVAGLLLCTSLFASYLALHNAAARYLFALGREKVLPSPLGRFSATRYAPSNASAAISAISVLAIGGFLLAGKDPYLTVLPSIIGVATLGIILLQALTSIAIVNYFRGITYAEKWRTRAAPAIGALGLTAAVALVTVNFSLLTGTEHALINRLPWIYPPVVLSAILFAVWLQKNRPATYAGIGSVELRSEARRGRREAPNYRHRYCVVGAGPCGLLAARAFKLEGVPYDQFERHHDVGGIWDIDNPGSPMYESAHFISSKYTSNFFGFPMPQSYPDYPNYRQLLSYIREFSRAYGLRDGIRFDTAVASAAPLGEEARQGWRVTLASGDVRDYRGIVCATGVTWHPSIPAYPGIERFTGEVRHTVTHRSAAQFKDRRVLIVGCGNSGADIACDAARNASAAFLSVRRGYRFVPKHIFGIPTDVFIGGRLAPPKGVVVPADVSELLDAVVGDLTRLGLPRPDHEALQSHPIMNTQILHHLAHGDLTAKPDILCFTANGAQFVDGSAESFDLVLFATGYDYKIPYIDASLFQWKTGHPDLYLNIFHRTLRGLSVLGFAEFADAGYQRFDEMAQMAAMDAYLAESGDRYEEWLQLRRTDTPNLRGAMTYIDSPRHANYVDVATYRRVLSEIRSRFGWPEPTDETYETLRTAPAITQ